MKKLYKKETFENKKEWLGARGIGGSSASIILGLNPFKNKLQLYNEINFGNRDKNIANERMQYGINLEPLIRKEFSIDFKEKYKVHTPKNNEMYRRIDKPFLTATLDGVLTRLSDKKKGILEIKTHDIRSLADEELWKNGLPYNYYIQVLHYLIVLNDFDFAVVVGRLRFLDYGSKETKKVEYVFHFIDRKEKEKDIEILEKAETDFYVNNVKNHKIPRVDIKF